MKPASIAGCFGLWMSTMKRHGSNCVAWISICIKSASHCKCVLYVCCWHVHHTHCGMLTLPRESPHLEIISCASLGFSSSCFWFLVSPGFSCDCFWFLVLSWASRGFSCGCFSMGFLVGLH